MIKINTNTRNVIKLLFIILMPITVYFIVALLLKLNVHTICIWKNIFHTDCWGCGITRAFYAFCHLDFKSAYSLNSKIFIIIPILGYIWIKEIRKAFSVISKDKT